METDERSGVVENTSNSRRQQVILLIDDETELLESVGRLLEQEGWTVHLSDDPVKGLEFYGGRWREIHLVLLDYSMHIYNGDEVFARLKKINPAVRVVLMTGTDSEIGEKLAKQGLHGFIQKPIPPQELIDQVRKALDSPTLSS